MRLPLTSEPNPGEMFPEWKQGIRWREKLAKKAAHKALDIPEADEMNIQQGMSGKAVAAIAAACGAAPVAAVLGVMQMMKTDEKPAPQPAPVVQPAPVEDGAYEILFYDSDGNLIEVPHKEAE